ncbi:uncharacterized protein LOC134224025 [Armigeres subalbatus]|uniref:uncharacterized protein LOC134224025 n=1 Tax=Armigeres subalbatus TaxID=124917 RepID=UPI002ED63592
MDIDKKHDEAIRFEADLVFTSDRPIFRKPYQVPYKIKEKFLKHLDDLEKQDIITPIQASEWAAPVIAILKKDNELRMIALGSHVLTAHRHQLKCLEQPKRKTTVMAIPSQPRRRGSVDTEDDFFGFPDDGSNWTVGPEIEGVEKVFPTRVPADESLERSETVRCSRKRKNIDRSPILTRSKMRRCTEE